MSILNNTDAPKRRGFDVENRQRWLITDPSLPFRSAGSPNETGGSPVPPFARESELCGPERLSPKLSKIGAEVSAKLKEANGKEIKFEEVAEKAKQAAVLVLVY